MPEFSAPTLFLGQTQQYLPSCQSTNDIVAEAFKTGNVHEGFLVWTAEQTSGRGQRGNQWESEPGKNLTCSIALRPSFLRASEQFYLSMAIALGIHDVLRKSLPKCSPQVKWPNDLYINGKKAAGILIENQLKGQFLGDTIVGIGLNVNQESFSIPTAASLKQMGQRHFELTELLTELLVGIEKRYLQLRQSKLRQLSQDYHQALLGLNEWRVLNDLRGSQPRSFYGCIRKVEPSGRLQVETQEGNVEGFWMKEISFASSS